MTSFFPFGSTLDSISLNVHLTADVATDFCLFRLFLRHHSFRLYILAVYPKSGHHSQDLLAESFFLCRSSDTEAGLFYDLYPELECFLRLKLPFLTFSNGRLYCTKNNA